MLTHVPMGRMGLVHNRHKHLMGGDLHPGPEHPEKGSLDRIPPVHCLIAQREYRTHTISRPQTHHFPSLDQWVGDIPYQMISSAQSPLRHPFDGEFDFFCDSGVWWDVYDDTSWSYLLGLMEVYPLFSYH